MLPAKGMPIWLSGIPMELHNFTLNYRLPDTADIDNVLERLSENCTDALVGAGVRGVVALEFDRECETKDMAVATAIEDVLKAIPGAVLIESRLA